MNSPPHKLHPSISFLGFTEPKIVATIISFLSFDDLMQLTLVSKEHNDIISINSSYIMGDKLQLTIAENWGHEFELSDVANSKRKYQSLYVKSLLRRSSEVAKFISNFAESLTTIVTTFDFDLKDVNLPMVKTLDMRIQDGNYREFGLLTTVNNLHTLKMTGGVKYENLHTMFAVCLSVNPKLQVLELEDRVAYEIFSRLPHNYFDFRLERFAINLPESQKNMQHFCYNLKNFLVSQSSLTDLKLMKIPFVYMLEIMSQLDNVECLTYSDGMCNEVHAFYPSGRLQIKESVRELRVVGDGKFRLAFNFLLGRFINLERVYYAKPDVNIFRDILKTRRVSDIKYAIYDDEEEQLFQRLEVLKKEGKLPPSQMHLSIVQI